MAGRFGRGDDEGDLTMVLPALDGRHHPDGIVPRRVLWWGLGVPGLGCVVGALIFSVAAVDPAGGAAFPMSPITALTLWSFMVGAATMFGLSFRSGSLGRLRAVLPPTLVFLTFAIAASWWKLPLLQLSAPSWWTRGVTVLWLVSLPCVLAAAVWASCFAYGKNPRVRSVVVERAPALWEMPRWLSVVIQGVGVLIVLGGLYLYLVPNTTGVWPWRVDKVEELVLSSIILGLGAATISNARQGRFWRTAPSSAMVLITATGTIVSMLVHAEQLLDAESVVRFLALLAGLVGLAGGGLMLGVSSGVRRVSQLNG